MEASEREPEVSAYDVTRFPEASDTRLRRGPRLSRAWRRDVPKGGPGTKLRNGGCQGRKARRIRPDRLSPPTWVGAHFRPVQPGSGFPGCPTPSPWQRRPTTVPGGLGALRRGCTYVRLAQLTSQLRVGLLAGRFSALDSERYALLGACRAPRSRGR